MVNNRICKAKTQPGFQNSLIIGLNVPSIDKGTCRYTRGLD